VHGVVCLKNVDLDEENLIAFADKFGTELVVLPKELSFNNKDPRYPPIARIGNILLDGSMKDSSKEATVWHQDGNFWDPADSYIFNFLHTRILPDEGGDTWFIDILSSSEKFKNENPETYEALRKFKVKVETAKIPDFVPLIREGMDLRTSYHDVVHVHPFNGKELLFLSNPAHQIAEDNPPVSLQDLQQYAID
jgi:alpha-ketoglutarate-dependent taurine dioxygenase